MLQIIFWLSRQSVGGIGLKQGLFFFFSRNAAFGELAQTQTYIPLPHGKTYPFLLWQQQILILFISAETSCRTRATSLSGSSLKTVCFWYVPILLVQSKMLAFVNGRIFVCHRNKSEHLALYHCESMAVIFVALKGGICLPLYWLYFFCVSNWGFLYARISWKMVEVSFPAVVFSRIYCQFLIFYLFIYFHLSFVDINTNDTEWLFLFHQVCNENNRFSLHCVNDDGLPAAAQTLQLWCSLIVV